MDNRNEDQAPRILDWAKAVTKLNELLRSDMFWLTQNKEMQIKIAFYKCVLVGIYKRHWADKEIGYPAALEIVEKWIGEEAEPVTVESSIKAIRTMEIVFMSVDLDIAAELYNQEFNTPDSFEKELMLGENS